MKNLAKNLLSLKVIIPNKARVVFVSHDLAEKGDRKYSDGNSTPPDLFLRQLDFLKKHFRFVSLEELMKSESDDSLASLTFDDGFFSVFEKALPILTKANIPFTVFCNAKAVQEDILNIDESYGSTPKISAGDRLYMGKKELLELHKCGVKIGSHGASHRALSSLNKEELITEINFNKKFLEDLVGYEIEYFAFPFGKERHMNEEAIEKCLEAGHKYVFSAIPRYIREKKAGQTAVIPRVSIHKQTEAELTLLLNKMLIQKFWK